MNRYRYESLQWTVICTLFHCAVSVHLGYTQTIVHVEEQGVMNGNHASDLLLNCTFKIVHGCLHSNMVLYVLLFEKDFSLWC